MNGSVCLTSVPSISTKTQYRVQIRNLHAKIGENKAEYERENQRYGEARRHTKQLLQRVADREKLAVVAATATRQAQAKYRDMKLELETFGALLAEKERGFNDELQRAHDSIKQERTKSRDLAAEKARLESDLQKCEAALGGVVAEVKRDRGAMENLRDLEFEVVESRARIEELELKNAELREALFEIRLVSRGASVLTGI